MNFIDCFAMAFKGSYVSIAKKFIIRGGIATTVVATGQAVWYRRRYEASALLPLPRGPMRGFIEHDLAEKSQDNIDLVEKKISQRNFLSWLGNWGHNNNKSDIVTKKRLKLLILGDSLVRGVGCDDGHDGSPVFPSVLAKVLSMALRMDVEWRAEGLIGGTVADIRGKYIPIVAEEFKLDESSASEFIVILICGLNDWKSILTNFPLGSGPAAFRLELASLISDIKDLAGSKPCKVFLPALPLNCGAQDPNCILSKAPLKYFVDAISFLWDVQKRYLAESESQVK